MAYSDPYYDPNYPTVYYNVSYNVELQNYLEKEYFKKCHRDISATEGVDICGIDSYHQMVIKPYTFIKKSDEEGNLMNDSKKSKAELLKEIKEDIAYFKELEDSHNKICDTKYKIYEKKIEEAKQKGFFYLKNKIYADMVKDGSLCSPTAHIDMVDKPFHEWRMNKLKNNVPKTRK